MGGKKGKDDVLQQKLTLNRRTALFFAAVCSLTGSIGSAYCNTWYAAAPLDASQQHLVSFRTNDCLRYQLLICRLILGVGMGAKASVYVAGYHEAHSHTED